MSDKDEERYGCHKCNEYDGYNKCPTKCFMIPEPGAIGATGAA